MAFLPHFIIFISFCCVISDCDDFSFEFNVTSIIEIDENGQPILQNYYTEFKDNDWINGTFFQPMLINDGSIQMRISPFPANNEILYFIDIHNFPWINDENSLQFCLNVLISNAQNLHFKGSNIESIITRSINSVDICHRFHANSDPFISHIYYSSLRKTDDSNYTLSNYTVFDLNHQSTSSQKRNHQTTWFFAVLILILVISITFVIVVLYLIKDGVFDENKRPKRKKSSITIVDTRPSSNRNSLPNTPKMRINVTYHNPGNMDKEEDDDVDVNEKKNTGMEISKTHSRPLNSLREGNEDEDGDDEDENDVLNNTITPLHCFNDSGTGIEESIIQYIINSQRRNNNLESAASPIPFCSA